MISRPSTAALAALLVFVACGPDEEPKKEPPPPPPTTVAVPDLSNMTEAEAEAALLSAELALGSTTRQLSETVPVGRIITQDPLPGAQVEKGSAVDLVVSLGAVVVTVPDVTGMSRDDAVAALTTAGLVVGTEVAVFHDTVPAQHVISQSPTAGEEVPNGSAVALTISIGNVPPDPAAVATAIDPTIPTDLYAANRFLFEGPNAVQGGVVPGTILPQQIAILRGRVRAKDGTPISGVKVHSPLFPEFGETRTRADGWYDLVINGGAPVRLAFLAEGYLPVHRELETPWRRFVSVSDVVLTPLDAQVTTIDFSAPVQVARGSEVTDADGARQGTLLFEQGTNAVMLAGGQTTPLSTIDVRITEYTVGETGLKAMPAALPPASAYTYAIELSVDEALAAGATRVMFDKPVIYHVENFIGFPTGVNVPLGWYDREDGRWKAERDGKVIEILSEAAGSAVIDTDGDGQADDQATLDALSVTAEELTKLAELYEPGQSLWRVAFNHFTPGDCNWPYRCRWACEPPEDDDDEDEEEEDEPCEPGSRIDCQSQSLADSIELIGTPIKLTYSSARTPGRRDREIYIPLVGDTVPQGLEEIRLKIEVAGQVHPEEDYLTFTPSAGLGYTFDWDGNDAFDREVQGGVTAVVRIGFTYEVLYIGWGQGDATFGRMGDSAATSYEMEVRGGEEAATFWRAREYQLGGMRYHQAKELGAWSIDVHHVYDPAKRILYLGNGRARSSASLPFGDMVERIAGVEEVCQPTNGEHCSNNVPAKEAMLRTVNNFALAPDGTIYFIEGYGRDESDGVRKIDREGMVTTIGGAPCPEGYCETEHRIGEPAMASLFNSLDRIEVGPDRLVYLVEWNGQDHSSVMLRIEKDGTLGHVAGDGELVWNQVGAEGDLATEVSIGAVTGIDFGPDGSIYFTDSKNSLLRQIAPDGRIWTLAGRAGSQGGSSSEDGGPASEALLYNPRDVNVAPDGTIWFVSKWGEPYGLRRITPDGIIETPYGGTEYFYGVPARDISIGWNVALGPDGTIHFAAPGLGGRSGRVYSIDPSDEMVYWSAGSEDPDVDRTAWKDGVSARTGYFSVKDMAVAPDNTIYILEATNIWRIVPSLPEGLTSSREILISSNDGKQVFHFDRTGRHLQTLDARTNEPIFTFAYDANGLLVTITDGDGGVLTIERGTDGVATSIVGPYGTEHTLGYDSNGYLNRVETPFGNNELEYDENGLLTLARDPGTNVRTFTYDTDDGRLTRHDEPNGSYRTLTRRRLRRDATRRTGVEVDVTTAMNRTTTYRKEWLYSGGLRRQTISPEGHLSEELLEADGLVRLTKPSGMVYEQRFDRDPRFGLQSPLLQSLHVTSPSGLTSESRVERTVLLEDNSDPFSLLSLTDTLTKDGATWTFAYDATTRTSTVTSPEGRQGVVEYDHLSRPLRIIEAGETPLRYTRDSRGRISIVSQQLGSFPSETQIAYDANGFPNRKTDPEQREWSYGTDARGNVETLARPDNEQIQFTYDEVGNVTSVTPAGSSTHQFTHDYLGKIEDYVAPDTTTLTTPTVAVLRDADHRMTSITQPGGTPVTYSYSNGSEPDSVSTSAGVIRYTYASNGLVATATTWDGESVAFTYDGKMLVGAAWSGTFSASVEATHCNEFRLASTTIGGALPSSLTRDQDGFVTSVDQLTFERAAVSGKITGSTLGVVTTETTYDDWGKLATHTVRAQGTVLFSQQLTRDAHGRIAGIDETIESDTFHEDYTYDNADRLTQVQRDSAVAASYSYDANGNRLTSESVTATYDAQDRLVAYGTATFVFDDAGLLSEQTDSGQTTRYHYDQLGGLRQVVLPDTTIIDYHIDPLGRRIGKRVDSTLQRGFIYHTGHGPIAELDGTGAVVNRFLFGSHLDVPDAMIRGADTYRIITDTRGSVRLVINTSDGTIAQRLDYDAFGRVLLDTDPGFQPYGFAAGLYDSDTGLVRFGARDYDARTGRWTAKDPKLFASGSTNLYAYSDNDPINFVDRSGLGRQDDCERRRDPEDDDEEEGGGEDEDECDNGYTEYEDPDWLKDRQESPDIPSWVADIVGWTAPIADLLGHGLAAGVLGQAAYPLAFEAAIDEGDRQAEIFRERDRRMRDAWRDSMRCP